MIAGEEDYGVISKLEFVQLIQQPAEVPVNGVNAGIVGLHFFFEQLLVELDRLRVCWFLIIVQDRIGRIDYRNSWIEIFERSEVCICHGQMGCMGSPEVKHQGKRFRLVFLYKLYGIVHKNIREITFVPFRIAISG